MRFGSTPLWEKSSAFPAYLVSLSFTSSPYTSDSHMPWKSRDGSTHSLYVAMSSSPSISSPAPSSLS